MDTSESLIRSNAAVSIVSIPKHCILKRSEIVYSTDTGVPETSDLSSQKMVSISGTKDGVDIYHNFVALHKPQLEASGVPEHFWKILSKKLHYQIFDAGDTFSLLKIVFEEGRKEQEPFWKVIVSTNRGLSVTEPFHIYLIDHAWTYNVNAAKHHLREIPGLLERMLNLMDLSNNCDESITTEELIDKVFNEMWKFNQTYTLGRVSNVEERLPLWYIMDEFGSAIQHSDAPTIRIVPFIHMPDQVMYSLLFPIKNVAQGEEVTRDYVEGYIEDSISRQALLLPWKSANFLVHSFEQTEPDSTYFLEGHVSESLPNYTNLKTYSPKARSVLKVFSEYSYVKAYLTHSRFVIVDNEEDADILWYTSHYKSFQTLSEVSPHKFVNQFPFEHVITVKDLLSIVCRRRAGTDNEYLNPLESYPVWFPTTYNLKTELPKFVSYFQHREKIGLDNHWICKPFNLARGLDTHITNNLNYILRLPFTGPKIAQKYIEQPILFDRPEIGSVKFDIRYVLVLKSVSPLSVYAYRNFFLRFANVPFELQDFDNYEKHFTVMNYNDSANLCHMLCDEFIANFEAQYNCEWRRVEEGIFKMLHSLFVAAVSQPPPAGIAHNSQSRALYAADLMLSWKDGVGGNREMQPKLLEVNWCPDCQRACEYYPDFYNDIFGLLFAEEEKDSFIKLEIK